MIKLSKFQKVLVITTFVVAIKILILKEYSWESLNKTKVSIKTRSNDSKMYVLFANDFFGLKAWGMTNSTSTKQDLESVNCPYTNCMFTSQEDLLPHVHNFNAVLFNVFHQKLLKLPLTRLHHQLYIFGSRE